MPTPIPACCRRGRRWWRVCHESTKRAAIRLNFLFKHPHLQMIRAWMEAAALVQGRISSHRPQSQPRGANGNGCAAAVFEPVSKLTRGHHSDSKVSTAVPSPPPPGMDTGAAGPVSRIRINGSEFQIMKNDDRLFPSAPPGAGAAAAGPVNRINGSESQMRRTTHPHLDLAWTLQRPVLLAESTALNFKQEER